MLILARKIGETIIIDGGIKITVIDIQSNQVKLGIDAPDEVNIYRSEVLERLEVETA